MSFVIFVVFLVFIYTTLQPAIKTQTDKQIIVDGIKEKTLNSWQVNLTTITIKTETTLTPPEIADCFSVDLNNFGVNLENKEVLVKNEEGEVVNFELSGDNLEIEWNGNADVFYKIYLSEQNFTRGGAMNDCKQFAGEDYKIGSVRTDLFPGLGRIVGSINQYKTDKDSLREYLGVPADSDFEFAINSSEMNIPFEEKNIKTNIYSDELPIQYVNNHAEIVSAFVYVRVW